VPERGSPQSHPEDSSRIPRRPDFVDGSRVGQRLRHDNQSHSLFVGGRLDVPQFSPPFLFTCDDDELTR
jgi:hypothetical protein